MRPAVLATLILLAGCSPGPERDAGLAAHQTVIVAGAGTPAERRLVVMEDARITPALRQAMWGGSKDPATVLHLPGILVDAGLRESLARQGFQRAELRLTDRDGKTLATRRLDCELGQIAEPALPQGDGTVWGVGDDCSAGGGDFSGLITRFLAPPGDKLAFEDYLDPATGERAELTLVTAHRFQWHLVPHGIAGLVHEVSSHPDYDDKRFKDLAPGADPPADLPWVVDYLTYRWDGTAWLRSIRTARDTHWSDDEAFSPEAAFP